MRRVMGDVENQAVTVLPPERPLRWRPEFVNFLRRQYQGLDAWAAETGSPIETLIRKAVDEALARRGFDGEPVLVEAAP
jgi:hypothetical protein